MIGRNLIAAGLLTLMVGCNAHVLPTPSISKKRGIQLTDKQELAVQDGVQQVLSSKVSLGPYRVKKLADESGLHVCGHASKNNSSGHEYPYYMELFDETNPPTLKRGQVGTDSASLAKVKFMCRRHGNI